MGRLKNIGKGVCIKKLIFVLVLLAAPVSMLLVSCGSSPTSSNSPTATPTFTSTPIPSFKTLITFGSAAVSLDGLCVDSSDNVYAADFFSAGANSRLLKVTSAGVTTQLTPIPNISSVAFDGTNWYAGAENSSYFYYYNGSTAIQSLGSGTSSWGTAINSSATTLALGSGNAVTLYYNFPTFTAGPNIVLPAAPNGPECLAYDNSGNLYVALNKVVIKYAAGTTSGPTTIAGQTTAGYVDGAATSVAEFNDLDAIAVGSNGNIYVADVGNSGSGISIRELSGSTVTTLVGPLSTGFVAPLLTSPTLTEPEGIAVDGSGNVFFSDRSNPDGAIYEYIP